MSYTALYRKFRPDNFADVKGQDHIVQTLRNQLKANRIGHAYLFTGTRGTGKTTMAKIFARAVNCENPGENGPCGECPVCKSIAQGNSLNVIEIDAASNNGVDNVREIIDEANYRPTEGRYKVYIIDEVHMLSTGAFNAMLKTLEEPPEYVIFILATTEVHKLPITVLSRCQRYDFRRISLDTIADRMRELIEVEQEQVEDKALQYIAKVADGSMRDALSLLDQCIAFNMGQELTYERALEVLGAVDTEVFSRLLRAVLKHDALTCIRIMDEIVVQGRELVQFVNDFTWYLRNLMLMQASSDLGDVIGMSAENLARLQEDAEQAEKEQIFRYIRLFSDLSNRIRYANQKRILIEVELIKLCRPQMESDKDSMHERVLVLEEKLENGVVAVAAADGEGGAPVAPKPAPVEKPLLPKALPEDVKRIMSNWKKVCQNNNATAAMILQKAKPSLGANGELELVFEQGDVAAHMAYSDVNQDAIAEILAEQLGKEVDFRIRETASHEEYENGTIDLRQVIAFDITEEE